VRILTTATDGFGGHGGIALYTRNLLSALCSHPGRPQVVALPRVMPLAPEAIPENLEWDVSGLGGGTRYVGAVLRAAVRRGPFDLVVCAHLHLLPLAYGVARACGAPLALCIYGIEVKERTTRTLTNYLASRVDAVISIRRHTTRALASWARPAGSARTFLLENAIDLARYGMAPKDPELVARFGLAGKRVLATVSRMGETYIGIDEVITALGQVAREVPDVVYFVGGDGPDLPRLRAKAEALGVADRIVFAGFVPDDRKADYYRLGDAYAMPGSGPDFDRYPLRFAFLEAMACGIPVVGATPEDPEEAALDGALLARQVDPHDSSAIARALVEALAMPKAIPAGLERFGYASFEKRTHAIVDELLGGRTSRWSGWNGWKGSKSPVRDLDRIDRGARTLSQASTLSRVRTPTKGTRSCI
jgi:phosphatidylinositol alpha-1,6-mannosyltransferase